jgi:hypothetical protein
MDDDNRIRELERMLWLLSQELAERADAEYPHRKRYASLMRKYEQDMGLVYQARALLENGS